eukprot:m.476623 g.476623  ORF g.476623 m.476623 type:complete len:132 (-) comp41464_c0_seq1:406-801(-)
MHWAALVLVAALWGSTNPLLRAGSEGVQHVRIKGSPFRQGLAELWFLATRWQYVCPFALNQLGTALFLWSLGTSDLSLAVPLCNSLTFVFSVLVGRMLGEPPQTPQTYLGLGLIMLGSSLCIAFKEDTPPP